jgi:hypothetical protein
LDRRATYTAGNIVQGKHDLVSKLFQLPYGFCAAVAGTLPICERFISYLWEYMEQLEQVSGPIQLDHIVGATKRAQWQIILTHFDQELVNKLGLTRNEWLDRHANATLRLEGRALLKNIKPAFACLIAGFLPRSSVLMRVVQNNVPEEIVSHSAIGSGALFAMQKLADRTQGPYCTIQRTGLGVSEALRYAKRKNSPYVGPPSHCVVLEPNEARQFDSNAELLRRWRKTIRDKKSDELDSEKYWKEFAPLLTPIPRTPQRPISPTAEMK